MFKNNKLTLLTNTRWAEIIAFIHEKEPTIKSLLLSAIHPAMLRAEVKLHHACEGDPTLEAVTTFPQAEEGIVIASIARPVPMDMVRLQRMVEQLSAHDLIMTAVHQIDVEIEPIS